MAAYDTIPAPASALGVRRIPHLLRAGVASLLTWNDVRISRKAMRRLSQRELSDIGLERGDLDALFGRRLISRRARSPASTTPRPAACRAA